jgi:proline iminopeptidase
MKPFFLLLTVSILFFSCTNNEEKPILVKDYYNYGEKGVKAGGVVMVPIKTPIGIFKVWTKRFGNNPAIKVLLLHGGPGSTHEYMESFESFFPQENIEFYEYDQLGSYYSDQPTDSSLWTNERFVDEVEQVRLALGLNKDNFFLLGNSWGGILAMEYALKYQQNLKGLIICNMMSSCIDYGRYAEVLMRKMDPNVLDTLKTLEAVKDYTNPKYTELLTKHYYKLHICRLAEWPEAVNRSFKHINPSVYVLMQGPSEMGISGRLANWDIKNRLKEITVPTLVVGANNDTMDPEHMKWMSSQFPKGQFLLCPNGSHMSMWDDQEHFFPGIIKFIKNVK